ncbi:hypothetical protein AWZ03_008788 [Drosophila navojoa]|uniref:Uncharacterized protein n=1 Tax=Drosophila navojoa TaxID=7232 RepID=A0A484B847_DRONA|nr:hypothetical protein AWZ03_008788 [Drosophila navojoa]
MLRGKPRPDLELVLELGTASLRLCHCQRACNILRHNWIAKKKTVKKKKQKKQMHWQKTPIQNLPQLNCGQNIVGLQCKHDRYLE